MKYVLRKRTSLVIALMLTSGLLSAQIVVNSLKALCSAVQQSNQTIVMTPGNYNLEDLSRDSREILCAGSDNIINLTGVYVKVPVGSVSTTYITVSGNNNTFRGGEFEDTYRNGMTEVTDFSAYNQDRKNLAKGLKGAAVMDVTGNGNRVVGVKLTVRGSFPYGYGSIYGIGAGNTFGLDKRCALLVTGNNNTLDSVEVQQRAFGHAIYMQSGADNTTIRNCLVEGITRPTSDFYNDSNAYDLPFRTDFLRPHMDNTPIPKDEMSTLCEDGIRMYNKTGSVTVENCTVKKMRGGIRLYLGGTAVVSNSKAIDCYHTNFNMSSGGKIINSSGNFAFGPLSDFRLGRSNMNIEWTIIPSPHAMGSHNLADVQGNNHTIVFHRTPGPVDTDKRQIVVTGDNSTITNETEYTIVLEPSTSGNTIISCGPVIDKGIGNDITLNDCSFDTFAAVKAEDNSDQ